MKFELDQNALSIVAAGLDALSRGVAGVMSDMQRQVDAHNAAARASVAKPKPAPANNNDHPMQPYGDA